MTQPALAAEDNLLNLFDRLRTLAFEQNPLQASGITMPQLTLLNWVAKSPGSGIHDIADGLNLTAPTVSVSVQRLEAEGLLERRPNPQDGRAIQIFLTVRGQTLHAEAHAFRREKMRSLLAGLRAEEGENLLALLSKAVQAVEETTRDAHT